MASEELKRGVSSKTLCSGLKCSEEVGLIRADVQMGAEAHKDAFIFSLQSME